jgi:O-antigen/teichoic acid export membrane protein
MSELKKLAGQTMWYGLSSVGAKMLNYLLNPILTYIMSDAKGVADFGDYSLLYACIAFVNIIFTYGFETGYFRFSNKPGVDQNTLFQTTFGSLIFSSILLCTLFGYFAPEINNFLNLDGHPEYIIWALLIMGLDAIIAIPFAKLRQESRPKRFAFIKLTGIVINILCVIFLLAYLPQYYEMHPNGWGVEWYFSQNKLGLILLSNLIMNAFVLLMLFPQWKSFRFKMDTKLWKQVFKYSSPMIVIGMAGMINEVVDRIMLAKLLPTDEMTSKMLLGIYGANYKLAIFITLFIQAFKMAAEPFFFKQATDKNSPQLYAKVMKWFVFTMCLAFLFTMLFIDIWQYLVQANYRVGLGVVPILLFANICLGIYYNLSVWYKITDKMNAGIYITLIGAIVTLVGNFYFIPLYGMYAAAWVTCLCYFIMVVVSYIMGQKYFPIPYSLSQITKLILLMLVAFGIHEGVMLLFKNTASNTLTHLLISVGTGTVLFFAYIGIVLKWFKEDLAGIALLKKLKI